MDEEKQFRRGYRQGFYAAVKAFDGLLREHKVPQTQVYDFLSSFTERGQLLDWLQSLEQDPVPEADPPDAVKNFLAQHGRHISYKSG